MTIATELRRAGPYTGNDVTYIFPFSFKVFAAGDVLVKVADVAGVETELTLDSDYTITLNPSQDDSPGGSVTLTDPLEDDATLVVLSRVAMLQPTLLTNKGGFYPTVINDALDRQTILIQQIAETLARAIVAPATDDAPAVLLPTLAQRVGKYLAFDALGNIIAATGSGADGALRTDLATTGSVLVNGSATGTGARVLTLADRLDLMPVSAAAYGYKPASTPAENKQALKDAFAATPTGGELVLPRGTCIVDVLLGRSDAVVINRAIVIRVEGIVQTNLTCTNTPAVNGVDVSGDLSINPPYVFEISAAGVTMIGRGTFRTNGTFNDQNFGDTATVTMPGFIIVTGNNFTCEGPTFDTPSKVGIYLLGCYGAIIIARFVGGPVTANNGVGEGPGGSNFPHTAYFGIRCNGGGLHYVRSRFEAGGVTGGKMIQCIWSGGYLGSANGTFVEGCWATAHEKLFYGHGDNHRVFDNWIQDAVRTDVIRIWGSNNIVSRNRGDNVLGVCTTFDGHDNEISWNNFTRIQQTAITVQRSAIGYVAGFDRTSITNNFVSGDPLSGTRTHGIAVYIEGANTGTDIVINDNTVLGFADGVGEALILLQAVSPATLSRPRADRNRLSNGTTGISFVRCLNYGADNNRFDSVTGYSLATSAGSGGKFNGNRGLGSIGNFGISGFNASVDVANDNQWDTNLLEFLVTMASGTNTITVVKAFIAANAKIYGEPFNDAAMVKVAEGFRYGVSGTSVTVAHVTGNNAVADELFRIRVVQ